MQQGREPPGNTPCLTLSVTSQVTVSLGAKQTVWQVAWGLYVEVYPSALLSGPPVAGGPRGAAGNTPVQRANRQGYQEHMCQPSWLLSWHSGISPALYGGAEGV
jgi:hypothetical protein